MWVLPKISLHLELTVLVPAQLPESKQKEAYGYHNIMAKDGDNYVLSPKDKQSNADSYAFAAGGRYTPFFWLSCVETYNGCLLTRRMIVWYLPLYYSDSGKWTVTKKADRFTLPTK